ncbi:MAG: prepilin-type N-terminal cleavage/methylation domain-containing protein [Bacilli bacterium]|nr:prepilin-type N-terminal cleavage/methylation domain-containing protein [Bacilli bacterium]MDD4608105.1 prepilin-type N-terminal cleavage/methylation domain-containing protein [Bacilli bacterium]
MKKNNGFTLIELIGVIVLIVIILSIAVPSVVEILKNANDSKGKELANMIELAAETYVEQNRDLFSNLTEVGSKEFIKVRTLIENDYIENEIKGVDDEDISNYTVIATVGNDNIIKYTYTNRNSDTTAYISDGLLLHYDAYNKPVDNTWHDLSGYNNDATLVGFEKVTSNGLTFDGVDDTVNASFTFPNDASTIQFVFESEVFRYTEFKFGPISFKWRIVNNIPYVNFWDTTSFYNSTPFDEILPINTPMLITITFDGNNRSLYVNSKLMKSVTKSLTLKVDNGIILGGGTEKLTGKMYGLRIYDKVLTDSEMEKNYEIDKDRFNI